MATDRLLLSTSEDHWRFMKNDDYSLKLAHTPNAVRHEDAGRSADAVGGVFEAVGEVDSLVPS